MTVRGSDSHFSSIKWRGANFGSHSLAQLPLACQCVIGLRLLNTSVAVDQSELAQLVSLSLTRVSACASRVIMSYILETLMMILCQCGNEKLIDIEEGLNDPR